MKYLTIAATALALSAGAASAATVTIELSGTVSSIQDNTGQAGSFFNTGDTFSYSVTLDSNATTPAAGAVTRDLDAITNYSVTFGSYSVAGNSGDLFLRENGATFGDQITLQHLSEPVYAGGFGLPGRTDFVTNSGPIGGFDLNSFQLSEASTVLDFIAPNASFLDIANGLASNSTFLADLSPSLRFSAGGDFGTLEVIANASVSSFTVTTSEPPVSPVPVPASLPLLAAGLIGMGAFARRKKSA